MKQYYITLIDRIFNILIIYEKKDQDTLKKYIDSLVSELDGNTDFQEICQIKYRINALLNANSLEHSIVRKQIFKSISLVNKILNNWEE